MELAFNAEQQMLRDAVAAFLDERYSFEMRRAALAAPPAWRPDVWRALAEELGVLGATFPEALGGSGGGPVETLVLMEEFGRALVVEPYVGTVVLGGGLLARSGHPAAPQLVAGIIAGRVILGFAQAEAGSRYRLDAVETRARRDAGGWRIDGLKKWVTGAPCASHLLVTARTAGGARDPDGISLFLVERNAPGVELREYVAHDGTLGADVAFGGVLVGSDALVGELDHALPQVERAVDEATAATCAEAVGVLRQLLERTLQYARERRQFGAPIGSFQALQHRMVDMYFELEQATSMARLAAIGAGHADPAARGVAVSSAKAQVGEACRRVGQGAIQIHGGMGMTDEMAVAHYFRRATLLESAFGSTEHHLARIEQLSGDPPA